MKDIILLIEKLVSHVSKVLGKSSSLEVYWDRLEKLFKESDVPFYLYPSIDDNMGVCFDSLVLILNSNRVNFETVKEIKSTVFDSNIKAGLMINIGAGSRGVKSFEISKYELGKMAKEKVWKY